MVPPKSFFAEESKLDFKSLLINEDSHSESLVMAACAASNSQEKNAENLQKYHFRFTMKRTCAGTYGRLSICNKDAWESAEFCRSVRQ
ncbi:hypothetical protein DOE51_14780 [Bdellovibrio sp. NC01]|nr:hypothetical protein DOE51_14780 [Bdellovibrio sp. NC01]